AMVRTEASVATYSRYEAAVANYLRPAWGSVPLLKFTPTHIQEAYAKWGCPGGRRDGRAGPLAPSTRRLLHRVLATSLNRAVELQVIPRNPTAILRRRLPKLERREMRTLSPEQSRTVLGELRGTPHYWPVLLALSTGGGVARYWRCAGGISISTAASCGSQRAFRRSSSSAPQKAASRAS